MRDRSTAAKGLFRSEEGATMVEYGLVIGFVSVACLAALTLIGDPVRGFFTAITGAIQSSASSGGNPGG